MYGRDGINGDSSLGVRGFFFCSHTHTQPHTHPQPLTSHCSDDGLYPRVLALTHAHWSSPWIVNVAMSSGSWLGVAVVMTVSMVAAMCFTVGYRTKFMGWMCWFCLMGLHYRTPIIVHSGDVLLRCLLFFANFMPLAEHLSVDGGLRYWHLLQRIKCDASFQEKQKSTQKKILWFGVAAVAYQLQLACVYIFSAIEKSGPSWRSDYSAVLHALQQPFLATWLGSFLAHHFTGALSVVTFLVAKWEFWAPFLLLVPLPRVRLAFVATGLMLHLGIGACMRLELLFWVPLMALVPLVPSMVWDTLLERWERLPRAPIVLYVDLEEWFSSRVAFVMHTFFLPAHVGVVWAHLDGVEEQCQGTWLAVMRSPPGGGCLVGAAALEELCLQSPLPLLWLVARGIRRFAGRVNAVLGLRWLVTRSEDDSPLRFRRIPTSTAAKRMLGVVDSPVQTPSMEWAQQFFLGALVVLAALFVLRHNWSAVGGGVPQYGPVWNAVGAVTGLHQRWDMFAPDPRLQYFWLFVEVQAGDSVQYLNPERGGVFALPGDWTSTRPDHPRSMATFFENSHRVFKYFDVGYLPGLVGVRSQFAAFLCRQYGGSILGQPGASWSVHGVFHSLEAGKLQDPPNINVLWQGSCASDPTRSSSINSGESSTSTSWMSTMISDGDDPTPEPGSVPAILEKEITRLREQLAQEGIARQEALDASERSTSSLVLVKMQLEACKRGSDGSNRAKLEDFLEASQQQQQHERSGGGSTPAVSGAVVKPPQRVRAPLLVRNQQPAFVGENIDRRPPWENILKPEAVRLRKRGLNASVSVLARLAQEWLYPTADITESPKNALKGKWILGKWVPEEAAVSIEEETTTTATTTTTTTKIPSTTTTTSTTTAPKED